MKNKEKGNNQGSITITLEIKNRIIEEIKRKNITQKTVAERIPVNPKHFSRVINGHFPASTQFISCLCKILDVRVDYILGNDEYRTESDVLIATGINETEEFKAMLNFLRVLGFDIAVVPPGQNLFASRVIKEKTFKQEGIPVELKEIETETALDKEEKKLLDDLGIKFPEKERSEFAILKESEDIDIPGLLYSATPEQMAIIFNSFKNIARETFSCLIGTGTKMLLEDKEDKEDDLSCSPELIPFV